jgi:hypothetical protein
VRAELLIGGESGMKGCKTPNKKNLSEGLLIINYEAPLTACTLRVAAVDWCGDREGASLLRDRGRCARRRRQGA